MIYLASPYSDPHALVRQRRYESALRAAGELICCGEIIYSPIVHCHNISLFHDLPKGFEYWRSYNEDMIGRAKGLKILKIEGWDRSAGVASEIKYAQKLNMAITDYFLNDNNTK